MDSSSSSSSRCKVCCNRSKKVTTNARTFRCHGCQTSISSSDNKLVDSKYFGGCKCHLTSITSSGSNETPDLNSFAKSKCLPFYRKPSRNVTFHCSTMIRTTSQQQQQQPPPRGKRALLCGVSYKSNKNNKLKGTNQDVINMKKLLSQKFGFPENAFLILGEDEQHKQPTRSNILDAFRWLMEDLQSEDSLVFYFSGHGLRQLNLDEDELDGFDEAICPVDFETAGMIVDNEINEMIVAPLKEGVTLHAIVDTCHSGTLLDLPYIYNRTKAVWDPPSRICKGTSGGHAICISACEDYQLATDTSMFSSDRTMAGAMTQTFIKAVSGKQEITYQDLLYLMQRGIEEANKSISKGIRRLFHSQMLQDPMLSSSKPFSIDKVFTL